MWVGWPLLWPAMAAATSTSTSTGATAFSAAMKMSPSTPTDACRAGREQCERDAAGQADGDLGHEAGAHQTARKHLQGRVHDERLLCRLMSGAR